MGLSGFKRPKVPGGAGGGNEFIYHVDEGAPVTCVLKGDPAFVLEHFDEATKERMPCTGDENCELCLSGNKAKQSFLINCFVMKDGKVVGKVLKLGGMHFDIFQEFENDFGDICNQVIVIRRKGQKAQTRYTVIPAKNAPKDLIAIATGQTPVSLKDLSSIGTKVRVAEPETPDDFDATTTPQEE